MRKEFLNNDLKKSWVCFKVLLNLRLNIKTWKSFTAVLNIRLNLELWVQFRVGFGAKTNIARWQLVICTDWYISVSSNSLNRFGFLLTHRNYLGNCHGYNSFVLFYVSMETSPWATVICLGGKSLVWPHLMSLWLCFEDILENKRRSFQS